MSNFYSILILTSHWCARFRARNRKTHDQRGFYRLKVVWAGTKWLYSIDLQPVYRKRAKRRTSNVILLIETSSVLAEKVKTATTAATPS